ncbi:MAG: hypothetical protein KBT00_03935 [Bacteroidales bacterium]|nr:hypothetical protein [Candidatus Cacconaster merdequi]
MRKIKLVIFSSILHDNVSVMGSREPLFEALRGFAEVELVYPAMLSSDRNRFRSMFDYDGSSSGKDILVNDENTRTVCFIATGGTEELFRQYMDLIPRPVILLSDGFHNSLAAAFEISTFLESNGIGCCLLNAPLDYNPLYFKTLEQKIFGEIPPISAEDLSSRNCSPYFGKADRKVLSGKRIGLLGQASSWLIASEIDVPLVEAEYGVKFVNVPLSDVENAFASVDEQDRTVKKTVLKMSGYLSDGRTEADLVKAARLYAAIRSICSDNKLDAVTVKCFGLLESCSTTACLALALLNDEGTVAGCEGDIPALWTMLYAREVLGKQSFMANPSSSNRSELTIDFGHCTIPLGMVHGYRLPSHFESSTGIGISGSLPSGRYRIIKFSGKALDRFYSVEGSVIMNTNVPQRCRTQVRFKFDCEEDFNGFFTTAKGNHIILLPL